MLSGLLWLVMLWMHGVKKPLILRQGQSYMEAGDGSNKWCWLDPGHHPIPCLSVQAQGGVLAGGPITSSPQLALPPQENTAAHTKGICPAVPIQPDPGKGIVVVYDGRGDDCFLRSVPIEDVEKIVMKDKP